MVLIVLYLQVSGVDCSVASSEWYQLSYGVVLFAYHCASDYPFGIFNFFLQIKHKINCGGTTEGGRVGKL